MKLSESRNKKATAVLLCLLIEICIVLLNGQTQSSVRLRDDSDWWSYTKSTDGGGEISVQKREIASTNFRVLGIDLSDDAFIQQAYKELGKVTAVHRGDASTGREQVCYVSGATKNKTYLIFERGEVSSSFYLFSAGPSWNGSNLCAQSTKISRSVVTGSGLRLGQTPEQVIGILGQPGARRQDELLYFFESKRKTAPDALARARKQHPELSEKKFHYDFDTYDLTVVVSAKFFHSEMTYLSVSTAETD